MTDVCALNARQIAGDDAGNVLVRNAVGLTKYDPAGQVVQTMPDPFPASSLSALGHENPLALGPQGEIYAGLRSATAVWLAKANSAGTLQWSKTITATTDPTTYWKRSFSYAIDALGNILVAFHSSGPVDLGNGPLPKLGSTDLILAKLDPQGNVIWEKRFGGPGFEAHDVSMRRTGTRDMAIVLEFSGLMDLGDGVLESSSVLAKFDSLGTLLWHADLATLFPFPITADTNHWALSGHPSGAVFVSGSGHAPMPPPPCEDWTSTHRPVRMVVARYGP
jgi:hypothetical protein